jgi:hypothetical protein
MLIFTDEDVPEPILTFLVGRGHTVHRTRQLLSPGSRDTTIASLASDHGAVVATFNSKHVLGHAKRRDAAGLPLYPDMSVIAFECEHALGLARMTATIDAVESIYDLRVKRGGGRLLAIVKKQSLRFDD